MDGDCLVTLENVKEPGKGNVLFYAGFSGRVYYRKTSQADWETKPIGISFNIDADVEF